MPSRDPCNRGAWTSSRKFYFWKLHLSHQVGGSCLIQSCLVVLRTKVFGQHCRRCQAVSKHTYLCVHVLTYPKPSFSPFMYIPDNGVSRSQDVNETPYPCHYPPPPAVIDLIFFGNNIHEQGPRRFHYDPRPNGVPSLPRAKTVSIESAE